MKYALRAFQGQKVERETFYADPDAVKLLRQVFMTLAAHDQYRLLSLPWIHSWQQQIE
jgi:hypothetical protein